MSDQFASRGRYHKRALIPERANRADVADHAVEHAVANLDPRQLAPKLGAGHHGQTFRGRLLRGRQHRPHTHRIDANRLLEEAVLAGLDAGREVGRAKMRRRAVEHDVDIGVDQLLERVEPRVAAVVRDLDALVLLQLLACRRNAIRKHVGKRHELQVGARIEKIDHRAAATATAPDQAGAQRLPVGRAGRAKRLPRRRLSEGAR